MNPSMRKPALILGSGEDRPEIVPAGFFGEGSAVVICADDGASLARSYGLRPHAIVGDQDSIDPESKEFWAAQGIPFYRFPTVKDRTDLDLAVEYALQLGATSITLAGAWGSRLDHALGNVELLYRLALQGIPNSLLTKRQRFAAICERFEGEVRVGSLVSLIPQSQVVSGVTTGGLRYPLKDATLTKGSTLTISNEAVEAGIRVSVKQGVLLIISEHEETP